MSEVLQNTARAHVDLENLRYGDNITGVIYLQVGDVHFPEPDWNDFPVIILRWWLKELLRLWHGELKSGESIECLFMDGDFYYSVSDCNGRWLIECVEGIPEGEVVVKAEVDRAEFMKNVIACAVQTLETSRTLKRQNHHGTRGRQNDGTDALATMIRRGRREILSQAA